MRELQKYYTGSHMDAMYLASEADAAFADRDQKLTDQANTIAHLREELSCALAANEDQHKLIGSLRREHAEEIERLKAALKHYAEPKNCEQFWIDEYYRYRKQAERYEKLRRNLNVKFPQKDFAEFDALIDQLPASGEKP